MRRIYIVIEELEHEVITCICNRKILGKYFIQAIVFTLFRRSIQLKKILKRFQLHFQKIRILHRIFNRSKIYSLILSI